MPNLYIIRHGDAEVPKGPMPDKDRALTPRGIEDVEHQARLIFKETSPLTVFHSPYVRARQTAEIIHKTAASELHEFPALVPSGQVEKVVDLFLGEDGDILLVSHMPLVAELVSAITGERAPFYPGSCALIEREDIYAPTGRLQWMKHPPY